MECLSIVPNDRDETPGDASLERHEKDALRHRPGGAVSYQTTTRVLAKTLAVQCYGKDFLYDRLNERCNPSFVLHPTYLSCPIITRSFVQLHIIRNFVDWLYFIRIFLFCCLIDHACLLYLHRPGRPRRHPLCNPSPNGCIIVFKASPMNYSRHANCRLRT